MTNIYFINKISCYGFSKGKGLGVFAKDDIPIGTLILQDLYRTIGCQEKKKLENTGVYHFLFVDREGYRKDTSSCDLHIAFGPVSIVNHSKFPNCTLEWTSDEGISQVKLISSCGIKKGEELLISYENINEYPAEDFVENRT